MSAQLRAPLDADGADEDDTCVVAAIKVRFEAVVRAQSQYEAARAAVRAYDALSTLARGREERRSRRALGLMDERWSRHCARMSLVELGFQTALSPLYHLPRDVRGLILVYVLRASVGLSRKNSPRTRSYFSNTRIVPFLSPRSEIACMQSRGVSFELPG